ncbi:MAG: oligoribonuclease [Planctomycetes bacterium]|nr:oligoribonuclease [Planctomycetota bacterium]
MTDQLKLVWIDLEMTGLNPDVDVILEVACIITGPDLKPRAETEAVIAAPADALNRMSDFVRDMHTKNGLLARVAKATVTVQQAEQQVLALVQSTANKARVLAGNSIHQDRRFLYRYMSTLESYLFYRQVDVSTPKVLREAWYPATPKFDKPGKDHTALADIKDSIAELAYYRANLLR